MKLFWHPVLIVLFGIGVFAATFAVLPASTWSTAVAVKVCGNFVVVRQDNGSLWLLRRHRAYRVEDLTSLCP